MPLPSTEFHDDDIAIFDCTFQGHFDHAKVNLRFPCSFFIQWKSTHSKQYIESYNKYKAKDSIVQFNETFVFTTQLIWDKDQRQFIKKQSVIKINLVSASRPDQIKLVGQTHIDLSEIANSQSRLLEGPRKLSYSSVGAELFFSVKLIQINKTDKLIGDLSSSSFNLQQITSLQSISRTSTNSIQKSQDRVDPKIQIIKQIQSKSIEDQVAINIQNQILKSQKNKTKNQNIIIEEDYIQLQATLSPRQLNEDLIRNPESNTTLSRNKSINQIFNSEIPSPEISKFYQTTRQQCITHFFSSHKIEQNIQVFQSSAQKYLFEQNSHLKNQLSQQFVKIQNLEDKLHLLNCQLEGEKLKNQSSILQADFAVNCQYETKIQQLQIKIEKKIVEFEELKEEYQRKKNQHENLIIIELRQKNNEWSQKYKEIKQKNEILEIEIQRKSEESKDYKYKFETNEEYLKSKAQEYETEINLFQNKLQQCSIIKEKLQIQLKIKQQFQIEDYFTEQLVYLRNLVNQLTESLQIKEQKIINLENILLTNDGKFNDLNGEINSLNIKVNLMTKQINIKTNEVNQLRHELSQQSNALTLKIYEISAKNNQLCNLKDSLNNKQNDTSSKDRQIDSLNKKLKERELEFEIISNQLNSITQEVKNLALELQDRSISHDNIQQRFRILKEQNLKLSQTIKQLNLGNSQITKRTLKETQQSQHETFKFQQQSTTKQEQLNTQDQQNNVLRSQNLLFQSQIKFLQQEIENKNHVINSISICPSPPQNQSLFIDLENQYQLKYEQMVDEYENQIAILKEEFIKYAEEFDKYREEMQGKMMEYECSRQQLQKALEIQLNKRNLESEVSSVPGYKTNSPQMQTNLFSQIKEDMFFTSQQKSFIEQEHKFVFTKHHHSQIIQQNQLFFELKIEQKQQQQFSPQFSPQPQNFQQKIQAYQQKIAQLETIIFQQLQEIADLKTTQFQITMNERNHLEHQDPQYITDHLQYNQTSKHLSENSIQHLEIQININQVHSIDQSHYHEDQIITTDEYLPARIQSTNFKTTRQICQKIENKNQVNIDKFNQKYVIGSEKIEERNYGNNDSQSNRISNLIRQELQTKSSTKLAQLQQRVYKLEIQNVRLIKQSTIKQFSVQTSIIEQNSAIFTMNDELLNKIHQLEDEINVKNEFLANMQDSVRQNYQIKYQLAEIRQQRKQLQNYLKEKQDKINELQFINIELKNTIEKGNIIENIPIDHLNEHNSQNINIQSNPNFQTLINTINLKQQKIISLKQNLHLTQQLTNQLKQENIQLTEIIQQLKQQLTSAQGQYICYKQKFIELQGQMGKLQEFNNDLEIQNWKLRDNLQAQTSHKIQLSAQFIEIQSQNVNFVDKKTELLHIVDHRFNQNSILPEIKQMSQSSEQISTDFKQPYPQPSDKLQQIQIVNQDNQPSDKLQLSIDQDGYMELQDKLIQTQNEMKILREQVGRGSDQLQQINTYLKEQVLFIKHLFEQLQSKYDDLNIEYKQYRDAYQQKINKFIVYGKQSWEQSTNPVLTTQSEIINTSQTIHLITIQQLKKQNQYISQKLNQLEFSNQIYGANNQQQGNQIIQKDHRISQLQLSITSFTQHIAQLTHDLQLQSNQIKKLSQQKQWIQKLSMSKKVEQGKEQANLRNKIASIEQQKNNQQMSFTKQVQKLKYTLWAKQNEIKEMMEQIRGLKLRIKQIRDENISKNDEINGLKQKQHQYSLNLLELSQKTNKIKQLTEKNVGLVQNIYSRQFEISKISLELQHVSLSIVELQKKDRKNEQNMLRLEGKLNEQKKDVLERGQIQKGLRDQILRYEEQLVQQLKIVQQLKGQLRQTQLKNWELIEQRLKSDEKQRSVVGHVKKLQGQARKVFEQMGKRQGQKDRQERIRQLERIKQINKVMEMELCSLKDKERLFMIKNHIRPNDQQSSVDNQTLTINILPPLEQYDVSFPSLQDQQNKKVQSLTKLVEDVLARNRQFQELMAKRPFLAIENQQLKSQLAKSLANINNLKQQIVTIQEQHQSALEVLHQQHQFNLQVKLDEIAHLKSSLSALQLEKLTFSKIFDNHKKCIKDSQMTIINLERKIEVFEDETARSKEEMASYGSLIQELNNKIKQKQQFILEIRHSNFIEISKKFSLIKDQKLIENGQEYNDVRLVTDLQGLLTQFTVQVQKIQNSQFQYSQSNNRSRLMHNVEIYRNKLIQQNIKGLGLRPQQIQGLILPRNKNYGQNCSSFSPNSKIIKMISHLNQVIQTRNNGSQAQNLLNLFNKKYQASINYPKQQQILQKCQKVSVQLLKIKAGLMKKLPFTDIMTRIKLCENTVGQLKEAINQ